MPDAHWGYGFPIGGVAAFDPAEGVVSGGGVGFDISCGVRTLLTGLQRTDIEPVKERLADALYGSIPAGLGSTGRIHLDESGMNAMLAGGARWAVNRGWGYREDLERIEEQGRMESAQPQAVSERPRGDAHRVGQNTQRHRAEAPRFDRRLRRLESFHVHGAPQARRLRESRTRLHEKPGIGGRRLGLCRA